MIQFGTDGEVQLQIDKLKQAGTILKVFSNVQHQAPSVDGPIFRKMTDAFDLMTDAVVSLDPKIRSTEMQEKLERMVGWISDYFHKNSPIKASTQTIHIQQHEHIPSVSSVLGDDIEQPSALQQDVPKAAVTEGEVVRESVCLASVSDATMVGTRTEAADKIVAADDDQCESGDISSTLDVMHAVETAVEGMASVHSILDDPTVKKHTKPPQNHSLSRLLSEAELEEQLTELFEVADVNGDGALQPTELKNMLEMCGFALTNREINSIVEEADTGHDGAIELDEFVELVTNMLQSTHSHQSAETGVNVISIPVPDSHGRQFHNPNELSSSSSCSGAIIMPPEKDELLLSSFDDASFQSELDGLMKVESDQDSHDEEDQSKLLNSFDDADFQTQLDGLLDEVTDSHLTNAPSSGTEPVAGLSGAELYKQYARDTAAGGRAIGRADNKLVSWLEQRGFGIYAERFKLDFGMTEVADLKYVTGD